jgi:hypothetical protein
VRLAAVVTLLCSSLGRSTSAEAGDVGDLSVPLVYLLTQPEKLDGMSVQVIGYLAYDSVLRIYLTRDHASVHDVLSSVSINVPLDDRDLPKCAGAYALVVGRFGVGRSGRFEILNPIRVERWDTVSGGMARCWEQTHD